MRQGDVTELETSGLATLAEDLSVLVDRLQADWDERRMVRPETAGELHELRARAERLLFSSG